MIFNPIWKDTYYVSTADTLNYRILLEGDEIYAGKAVKYPDADEMFINVNKICSNYLESDIEVLLNLMPDSSTAITQNQAQRQFDFEVNDAVVETYVFYNDWSYSDDVEVTGSSIYLSNPINGHYVPGMLRLLTQRWTKDYIMNVITAGNIGSYETASTIPAENRLYPTQVKCTPYVLYYLNSYGGWDAFVIEGNTNKKDAFTTFTTDRAFNNTTLEFEYNKYIQEIKTTYVMNTGLLTDEQSSNLAKNLVGSLKVYLHNIDEGWVKPVVITDSSVDYQTYTTNGRKLSQYKITVQESQTKVRK